MYTGCVDYVTSCVHVSWYIPFSKLWLVNSMNLLLLRLRFHSNRKGPVNRYARVEGVEAFADPRTVLFFDMGSSGTRASVVEVKAWRVKGRSFRVER